MLPLKRDVVAFISLMFTTWVSLGIILCYVPVASANYIHVVKLEKPIDVNGLLRFIPLMTAYTYALDRIQVPTHTIYAEDSYVYYLGNHSVYNWIIEPEGFWNELIRKPVGVVFVYGDSYPHMSRLSGGN